METMDHNTEQAVARYDTEIKMAEERDTPAAFVALGHVEEAHRDISRAVAELRERLASALDPDRPDGATADSDPARSASPLVERLRTLNHEQHGTLFAIADIAARLEV